MSIAQNNEVEFSTPLPTTTITRETITYAGYPPHAAGYPPHAAGYPPHAAGYPPHAASYPPHAASYPPHAAGYPPHAASYPPHMQQEAMRLVSGTAMTVPPSAGSTMPSQGHALWLFVAFCLVFGVVFLSLDPKAISLAAKAAKDDQAVVVGASIGGNEQYRSTDPHVGAGILPNAPPPGNYHLRNPPSITADKINGILEEWRSPAGGTGPLWYQIGLEYGIDPAFAVAFFIHESAAGTAPGWAGRKGNGTTTHNVGNIICAGYPTCFGRFRDYPNWEDGIRDWYRLIDVEYLKGRNHQTVADIIAVYAPSSENNVPLYVTTVHNLVDKWRQEMQAELAQEPSAQGVECNQPHSIPYGNPLRDPRTVITQGYGVGTHAPSAIWGAIDLAIDGDGNGVADPTGTHGVPIYATMQGDVQVSLNTYPAGNHVWVSGADWRTGYAHLDQVTVVHGSSVNRGDQIGTVGSTGMSSGPHLDYQVWSREAGSWVNRDPMITSPLEICH